MYRAIPSRFPVTGIFDSVTSPDDLEVILLLEAATNPRVLEEAGRLELVRREDRISGPGTTPIMASFTHVKPSRFTDASFGVFYAGFERETAIAETAYHRSQFLKNAGLPEERLDMRMYRAAIRGSYEDIRSIARRNKVYNRTSYAASQAFGIKIYQENKRDGIVYSSVRKRAATCVAVFKPRCVTSCETIAHLEYRFENYELAAVYNLEDYGEARS